MGGLLRKKRALGFLWKSDWFVKEDRKHDSPLLSILETLLVVCSEKPYLTSSVSMLYVGHHTDSGSRGPLNGTPSLN